MIDLWYIKDQTQKKRWS